MKLPFRLIWHPSYNLHIGDHVFPAQKFRMIRERLIEENIAEPDDFIVEKRRDSVFQNTEFELWLQPSLRLSIRFVPALSRSLPCVR